MGHYRRGHGSCKTRDNRSCRLKAAAIEHGPCAECTTTGVKLITRPYVADTTPATNALVSVRLFCFPGVHWTASSRQPVADEEILAVREKNVYVICNFILLTLIADVRCKIVMYKSH